MVEQVVVIGGGIIGLSSALALASSKISVTLITREVPLPESEYQTSFQVCAVNRASENLLKYLDIWQSCQAIAYDSMQLKMPSGKPGFKFCANECNEDNLGHIIVNDRLKSVLYQEVCRSKYIHVYQASLESVDYQNGYWNIKADDGLELISQVVIGADGKCSKLAQLLEWSYHTTHYKQFAHVALVKSHHSSHHAYQYFHPRGLIALLPLGGGHRWSMIMSLDEGDHMDIKDVQVLLKEGFEDDLGSMQVDKLSRFPLQGHHAHLYMKRGAYLVGDALHSIHPMAGQGMNLGLMDVAALVDVLTTVADWQGREALAKYHYWRRGHNQLTYDAMDYFKFIFQAQAGPWAILRDLGLPWFNQSFCLKRQCAKIALGQVGRLPPLVRSGY